MLKVSIVTPTFNSAQTIVDTTTSIVTQDYPTIEHVIVDNCSSDETLSLIEQISREATKAEPRTLSICSEPDKGISDAFNRGLNRATGDILTILNSDDSYLHPNVVSQVAKIFADNPAIDFIHGDILFVDDQYGTNIRRPLLCPMTQAMPYNHPTFFFRRRLWEELGPFKLTYKIAMDFEWMCRMYATPATCTKVGHYLAGEPMVKMMAGGESWSNELASFGELESALKAHNLWDQSAAKALFWRTQRVRLKSLLTTVGLNGVVAKWRHWKWKNSGTSKADPLRP